MFKVKNTWKNVASPTNQQRGQPAPGTGGQQTGHARQAPTEVAQVQMSKFTGSISWLDPADPTEAQRGFPAPEGPLQAYAPGELSSVPPDGTTTYRVTRPFSRGAQRAAPITPILMSTPNPGVRVTNKPKVVPTYPLGQYINNTIFWANQVIPTSVTLQGLQTEDAIDAMLANWNVYGHAETV